jgi:hypothetical protein
VVVVTVASAVLVLVVIVAAESVLVSGEGCNTHTQRSRHEWCCERSKFCAFPSQLSDANVAVHHSFAPWFAVSFAPWFANSFAPWFADSFAPWFADSFAPWLLSCCI